MSDTKKWLSGLAVLGIIFLISGIAYAVWYLYDQSLKDHARQIESNAHFYCRQKYPAPDMWMGSDLPPTSITQAWHDQSVCVEIYEAGGRSA